MKLNLPHDLDEDSQSNSEMLAHVHHTMRYFSKSLRSIASPMIL
jgi:hypothetical protein